MTALDQHHVNEAARLIARFDTVLEDAQRAIARGLMECDAGMARLQGRPTVKCERCRVEVDQSKVHLPNRCMDKQCPHKPKDEVQ